MPNRHGQADSYRYGFNGMEADDEIKGEGNSYDFGARMLDPRVGRWFKPDRSEFKYPALSTYNAFANNPLYFLDPDGNDILPWKVKNTFFGYHYSTSYPSFADFLGSDVKFDNSITTLTKNSDIFNKVYNQLKGSERVFQFRTVSETARDRMKRRLSGGGDHAGYFDPNNKGTSGDPYTINVVINLQDDATYASNQGTVFEETFHAAQTDYEIGIADKYQTKLTKEVEAKLVKQIERVKGGGNYEKIEFENKDLVFEKIRTAKKLSKTELMNLTNGINKMAEQIAKVYKFEYDETFTIMEIDLKFAESLYGQILNGGNHAANENNVDVQPSNEDTE